MRPIKKIRASVMGMLLTGFAFSQTATNFTATDCSNTPHDLFNELEEGKIIVLTWVMPCGSCIGVALNVASVVAEYANSHPGRVKFYLADDFANTSCSSLSAWSGANGISPDAEFSSSAIKMSDYGTASMQKTIVLGGAGHTVFYNVIDAVNSENLRMAINNALAATDVSEHSSENFQIQTFPNPTNNKLFVSYTLPRQEYIKMEIINMLGKKVKEISYDVKQTAGQQELFISTEELNPGVYFLKISAAFNYGLVKFTVVD